MKNLPTIFGSLGLVMSIFDYMNVKIREIIIVQTKGVPQEEVTTFFFYLLPSLVGFVASLSSHYAPKAAGWFMVCAGVVCSFVLTDATVAILTGTLYVIGGISLINPINYETNFIKRKKP
jgi:hypothetical protein